MELTPQQQREEWLACAEGWEGAAFFIHNYCQIYDANKRLWVPFHLWPAQVRVLRDMFKEQQLIVLKARQLGLTWLVLAFELWEMLFHPIATALNFSKRDDEAVYLLGDERLKGMYKHLPPWMQARSVLQDSAHEFALSNGSIARAFPTTAGDSYTATFALVDEADLVPNLARLMGAVQPTIDMGGKIVLISRPDKDAPESLFKQIYRAAKAKQNSWHAVFLPWSAHPGRTAEWYAQKCADALANTGALDEVQAQYPATETEALSPRTLNKRIAPIFLQRNYVEIKPAEFAPGEALPPALPGLVVWRKPAGKNYFIGADPAEGNPTSDPSSATVMEQDTGEEVARLTGQIEPTVFAQQINQIAQYYNDASVLVERNNHGHTVIAHLRDHTNINVLEGPDEKLGWLSNHLGKVKLYDECADAFRDGTVTLHSFSTFTQLSSIDGSTLRAPTGQHDDEADGFALANMARMLEDGPLVHGLKDDE